MGRKPGRPAKRPEDRRSIRIGVPLTPAEYALLSRMADEAGVALAELVRSRVLSPRP